MIANNDLDFIFQAFKILPYFSDFKLRVAFIDNIAIAQSLADRLEDIEDLSDMKRMKLLPCVQMLVCSS